MAALDEDRIRNEPSRPISAQKPVQAAVPVLGQTLRRHNASAHGVQMDVMRDLPESFPGLDVQRLVAALEGPASLPPEPIESRRPCSLQPLHRLAQIRLWRFYGQMKVVAHHHIRVNPPAEPLCRFGQALLESLGRSFSAEKFAPIIAAVDDVVAGARDLDPKFPCHGRDPAPGPATVKPPISSSSGLVENSHMTPSDRLKRDDACARARHITIPIFV